MLMLFNIASAVGETIFWGAIILFTIISQIVKASRRSSISKDQFRKDDSSPSSSPEEELRSFLENLTGAPQGSTPSPSPRRTPQRPDPSQRPQPPVLAYAPQQPTRPAPPPPPKIVRHSTRVTTRAAAPKARVVVATPVRVQSARKAKQKTALGDAYSSKHASERTEIRMNVTRQLAKRDSLKEAILLREILGPPLALRNSRSERQWSAS
jgi:hypothetical protein